MDQNTSPYSPFELDDYKKVKRLTEENLYPEEESLRFKKNYVLYNPEMKVENIELANGADEWIQKLIFVFGEKGTLTLNPDFYMYQDYANQLGRKIEFVDADDDFIFNIDEVADEIMRLQPSLFIMSNPHNPTGHQFSEEALQKLADAVEAVSGYFVIDEAYIEFGKDYRRPQGDHILILRTMSKIYGMAGLRIGVIHATGKAYEKVTKVNHPYPINLLSLNLANEFLEDRGRVEDYKEIQLKSKEELVKSFQKVSDVIHVKPSATNFVFTYGDRAINLGRFLQAKGFQARFYEEENLSHVVRYSIIKLEDYPTLNQAIEEWRETID